ncbi:TPA: gamma-glutamylcyclotransferase [Burkholderia aenigmatica]|nr:gamma-glutamylcyclotransferase [Burkholderia aenigmatica]HDR9514327.1 gamma-glutamylcyclotransferase [Burkholderia aenigmatica]HDR9591717.1 gamma-glutamylcyclotransferase [Burkholderia aenigmatica]HDR9600957.1 gamma-glutamylcyclotransferase [Burkholderia aenigmatica]HDR9607566.1 gamma-glutamylcyclotransferase [Burkholderia aenigmatica]
MSALCYQSNLDSDRYCSINNIDDLERIVTSAKGLFGTNSEYVIQTAGALKHYGLCDHFLELLCSRIMRTNPNILG